MSELRRSGRANKGQHSKSADTEYPSLVKKRTKKAENAAPAPKPAETGPASADGSGSDEDDATVRCVCGATEDLGGRMMIECEGCEVWQHNICMGFPEAEDETLSFYCEQCRPDLHTELLEAIARGEKIWEERMAIADRKKRGKRRGASKKAEKADRDVPKRRLEGGEGPEAKRAKTEEQVKQADSKKPELPPHIPPPRSRVVDILAQDLVGLYPSTVRAGLIKPPAGIPIDAQNPSPVITRSIRAAVIPIERALASITDNAAYNEGLAAIRHNLRTRPELVGRTLRGEASFSELVERRAGPSPLVSLSSVTASHSPLKTAPAEDRPDRVAFHRRLLQGMQCAVNITGRFVGGGDFRTLFSLENLLPSPIELNGRTHAASGDEYCVRLDASSMDVMVCALEPSATPHDRARWEYVCQYYLSKRRWGVINLHTLREPVVDMYVIPLGPKDPFPTFFGKLRFVDIPAQRAGPMLLLAIIAHTRPAVDDVALVTPASVPSSLGPGPERGALPPAAATVHRSSSSQSGPSGPMKNGENGWSGTAPVAAVSTVVPMTAPARTTTFRGKVGGFTERADSSGQPGAAKNGAIPEHSPQLQGAGSVKQQTSAPALGSTTSSLPASQKAAVLAPAPVSQSSVSSADSIRTASVRSETSKSESTTELTTTESMSQPGGGGAPAPAPVPGHTSPEFTATQQAILGPLTTLPIISQLRTAGELERMSVPKLQTLRAVLDAHPRVQDLGVMLEILQRHGSPAAQEAAIAAAAVNDGAAAATAGRGRSGTDGGGSAAAPFPASGSGGSESSQAGSVVKNGVVGEQEKGADPSPDAAVGGGVGGVGSGAVPPQQLTSAPAAP